jgi:23S rRNA (cytidine1920-2'-O)/16S rRNA (cytidine1409-2'-O)-methyltransferase
MAASARRASCRLDILLVERGLAPTRAKAQALVLAGRVRSAGMRLEKPGSRHPPDLPLEGEPGRRWVSRGAEKLLPALERFAVRVAGRDALDVGASTGGFTQVLLESGARRVAALDVGRGQLDWSLRNDPRVIVLEGHNARHLRPEDLPFQPTLAVADVSFISLTLVLPAVAGCLAREGEIVALVKPQFEAGRASVPRGGVVRDPQVHRRVLLDTLGAFRGRGWGVRDVCASALRGADGNREFFVHLRPGGAGRAAPELERRLERALAEEGER